MRTYIAPFLALLLTTCVPSYAPAPEIEQAQETNRCAEVWEHADPYENYLTILSNMEQETREKTLSRNNTQALLQFLKTKGVDIDTVPKDILESVNEAKMIYFPALNTITILFINEERCIISNLTGSAPFITKIFVDFIKTLERGSI